MKIILDGYSLTPSSLKAIATNPGWKVRVSKGALEKVEKTRKIIEDAVENDQVIYGVTTGFGSLCKEVISKEDTALLQKNLILSHSCGVGNFAPREIVRAMIAIRINTLIKGHSGIRNIAISRLVDGLNNDMIPDVPLKGSVGASGDLCPLSHMCSALFYGIGTMNGGEDAKEVLLKHGFEPLELLSKEGLSLNNGTQFITANLALGMERMKKMMDSAVLVVALVGHTLQAQRAAYDSRVHVIRNHSGQIKVAEMLWKLLEKTPNQGQVQDAYSLRCLPQILGLPYEMVDYLGEIVEEELNAATDNPLICDNDIISAGNFHGQYPGLCADIATLLIHVVGNVTQALIYRLTCSGMSRGLPGFLVSNAGLNSGAMIPQYTAAALVSENKVLCHPSTADSIPTCDGQEDHVSMGAYAARKFGEVLDNVENVLTIALLLAKQAWELRYNGRIEKGFKSDPSFLGKIFENMQKEIPYFNEDIYWYKYMNIARKYFRELPWVSSLIE